MDNIPGVETPITSSEKYKSLAYGFGIGLAHAAAATISLPVYFGYVAGKKKKKQNPLIGAFAGWVIVNVLSVGVLQHKEHNLMIYDSPHVKISQRNDIGASQDKNSNLGARIGEGLLSFATNAPLYRAIRLNAGFPSTDVEVYAKDDNSSIKGKYSFPGRTNHIDSILIENKDPVEFIVNNSLFNSPAANKKYDGLCKHIFELEKQKASLSEEQDFSF